MAYPIKTVRLTSAPEGDHEHLDLIGYLSAHTPYEPVMVPLPRIHAKMAEGEDFYVEHEGEQVLVKTGKCHVCGHEPYLVTERDPSGGNLLLELPQV